MKLKEIANLRLANQHISQTRFNTPEEIVSWMGAIQAQDYAMAKWAVGVRLPGSTEKEIDSAFNKGTILRTHLLRPTWHLVSPEDIYWMLELTAPHIRTSSRSRWKELEIDEKVCNKCSRIIEKILAGNKHLTRDEIFENLETAGIKTSNQRGVHLLMEAELKGLICSGRIKGNQRTYALLEERFPRKKILPREEALAELAGRYFLSHGPATLKDFAWWSGLPVKDARLAVEAAKEKLSSVKIGTHVYWFNNSVSLPDKLTAAYLLPAYDEYLISYKDRSASIDLEHHKNTVSNNGIFRPAVIINGRVAGIWKKTVREKEITIEIKFFLKPSKTAVQSLVMKSKEIGKFLYKNARLLFQ